MNYDVVVVGNGPAGAVAARHSASANETAIVGECDRRVQCAGLISKSGLERIGVCGGGFVLNKVRGARLFSPSGVEVEVDAKSTKAYAVDRLMFDRHLLERASDSGAHVIEDWVSSLSNGVSLASGGKITPKRKILATGTDYTLQIQHGIERPREFLIGGQYELDVECDPDFVELHFILPEFFAWVIPLGDRARVGLCAKSNPRPHLNSFVKGLKSRGRLRSERVISESFGIIPIHQPSMRTQFGDTVTVGDAAGQVKATTGGGIVFGAIAAEYATMPDYERLWRSKIGGDLKTHLWVYRIMSRLSEKGKDRLFTALRDSQGALERRGDMDYASKTVSGMFKDPKFMASLLPKLPWLLADLL